MGKLKFDKEFQCLSYSSGKQLFVQDVLDTAKYNGKDYRVHQRITNDYGFDWAYYIGVDLARSGSASADSTVVTVLAYNSKTNIKRVSWVWTAKGMKISDQVEHVVQIARDFNYPVLLVEKNNMGQDFIDLLIDKYNLNVEAFTTSKTSKQDLIRFLITSLENEKLILPTGDARSKEMIGDLEYELQRFVVEVTRAGNEVMKGAGKTHDDKVISLALANKCSQFFGYEPCLESLNRKHKSELEMFAETNDPLEYLKL